MVSPELQVRAVSHIYETEPMYMEAQPEFYNAALIAETSLGPLQALRLLKCIERQIGRTPGARYGPREIDLDLISYGSLRYRYTDSQDAVLVLPHPRTVERRFVLQPLAEIAPDLKLPGMGIVADLLNATDGQAGAVRQVSNAILSVLGQ
jgi:2-amino-4-hydroxy-6-hydroxymethyldihydropteridine diphosphokinase